MQKIIADVIDKIVRPGGQGSLGYGEICHVCHKTKPLDVINQVQFRQLDKTEQSQVIELIDKLVRLGLPTERIVTQCESMGFCQRCMDSFLESLPSHMTVADEILDPVIAGIVHRTYTDVRRCAICNAHAPSSLFRIFIKKPIYLGLYQVLVSEFYSVDIAKYHDENIVGHDICDECYWPFKKRLPPEVRIPYIMDNRDEFYDFTGYEHPSHWGDKDGK